MRQRSIIIVLILSLLIVIFATQNAADVSVKLWFFTFTSALSLVIIGSILIGAAVTWAILATMVLKRKKTIEKQEEIIKEMQDKLSADPFKIDL